MIINPYRFGASPLLTNLISYWKLDEASGTRNDSHGTNHLTDNNTVTQAVGKIGNCAQFTAANSEFLSIADNASFDLSGAMSASFWVYRDTVGLDETYVGKWTYDTDGEFVFQSGSTDMNKMRIFLATSAGDPGSGCNMEFASFATVASTWYHLAVVFDGSLSGNANRLKVYQNGSALTLSVVAGAVPATLRNGTAPFHLGKFGGALTRYHNGRLDEVGLWSRALTSGEVAQLYNSGNGVTYPAFV